MFHLICKSLIFRYLAISFCLLMGPGVSFAAEQPPYAAYFNPEQGFRPVQPNLSRVFLQLAGSLEYDGTPEPYIRHVIAEHVRIDARYHANGGKGSSRPAYLTDDYVENLIANWKKIAPPLKLDAFCRDAGRNMRYAILGSKNLSVPELVEFEKSLTESERKAYRNLLDKPYFGKADFPAMEAFYGSTFDKLTETGKDQISRRTRLGTLSPEVRKKELAAPVGGTALVRLLNGEQDKTVASMEDRTKPKSNADTLQAGLIEFLKLGSDLNIPKGASPFDAEPLVFSHEIRDGYLRRIEAVKKTAQTPEQAAMIEKAMRLMLENLVVITQSEFEAAVCEQARKMRESER